MEQKRSKKVFLLVLFVFLVGIEVYLHFFAPVSVRVGVETTQIDKILHLLGGVFLALLLEWKMSSFSFWRVFGVVILLSIVWKIFEVFSDPSAKRFVLAHLGAWSFDATGDTAATLLGALGYWQMIAGRRNIKSSSQ